MRALPLLVALLMAIPATFVVAMPRPVEDALPAPLRAPAAGPGGAHGHGEDAPARGHEHGGHAQGSAAAAPAHPAEHAHARERTAWPPAEGAIPKSTAELVEVRELRIRGEPDLAELDKLGVTLAGSGTLADPYVLEGLWVRRVLELRDTEDHYVIRNSVIDGALRLNWNDDRVHVHHNKVRDLRVNENIERTGEATGGLIELNLFGVVGQIRHFDGVFRANEVGPIPAGMFDAIIEDSGLHTPFFAQARAVNIDGFDGAIFEDNTIFGYVEMQLHGHHHASCFACHSHNHAVEKAMKHDHSIRYHEADFRRNVIVVEDGVAFRYTDAAHSGDDRRATSEPNEALEKPHVHFTRIAIEDNVVEGGPMVIDILNADSSRHANEETRAIEPVAAHAGHAYRAELRVAGNQVTWRVPEKPLVVPWLEEAIEDALLVRRVKEANVELVANTLVLGGATSPRPIAGLPLVGAWLAADAPAALHMRDVRSARLLVAENTLEGAHFGILARGFAEDAAWLDGGNAFRGVKKEMETDRDARPVER